MIHSSPFALRFSPEFSTKLINRAVQMAAIFSDLRWMLLQPEQMGANPRVPPAEAGSEFI
jgi:hypothetical protein